jgi:hypothetical protein
MLVGCGLPVGQSHTLSPSTCADLQCRLPSVLAENRCKMAESEQKNVALFVATLFHSATVTHFMHLSTDSYAKHKALQKYYENIVDLTDAVAESYMGYEEVKLTQWPKEFHLASDPVTYLEKLRDFVEEIRKVICPEYTPIQNQIDAIQELMDSTIYKLKFLS